MKSIKFICAGLLLCTFFSCYNSKKASKQVDKALFYYSDVAAQKLREKFPCVVATIGTNRLKNDIAYNDSIINVLQNVLDSVAHTNDSLMMVPGKERVIVETDTAAVRALVRENVRLTKDNTKLTD